MLLMQNSENLQASVEQGCCNSQRLLDFHQISWNFSVTLGYQPYSTHSWSENFAAKEKEVPEMMSVHSLCWIFVLYFCRHIKLNDNC